MHCHGDWQYRETLEIKGKRLINRNREAFLMEVRKPLFRFVLMSLVMMMAILLPGDRTLVRQCRRIARAFNMPPTCPRGLGSGVTPIASWLVKTV